MVHPIREKIQSNVLSTLLTQFWNENWGKVVVFIVTIIFATGFAYATLKAQLNENTAAIQDIRTNINTQLEQLNKKVDDINTYLRDHK